MIAFLKGIAGVAAIIGLLMMGFVLAQSMHLSQPLAQPLTQQLSQHQLMVPALLCLTVGGSLLLLTSSLNHR